MTGNNLMSDTPFIRIGDGSLVIHAYWSSSPANYTKALTAYKNGVSISDVKDTKSYSYRSNTTLIHLPSSKKYCLRIPITIHPMYAYPCFPIQTMEN